MLDSAIALVIFVIDTVIETTILMTSEEYKAENVYSNGNVNIPNSAAFNNPIAQLIYSNYLYENVKMEDESNFFTGDPYDLVGEWQAHNIAANLQELYWYCFLYLLLCCLMAIIFGT